MRRPVLLLLFFEAAGIVFGYYTKLSAFLFAAQVLAGAAALLFFLRKRRVSFKSWFCVLCVFLLFFGFFSVRRKLIGPFDLLDGEVCGFSGVAGASRPGKGYTAITLSVPEGKILLKVKKEFENPYAFAGREISCKGRAALPRRRGNPGEFDYGLYLKARGIELICDVSEYRFFSGEVKRPFLYFLSLCKGEFIKEAKKYFGEEELGILTGLLFGEKFYLGDDLYEAFKDNGTAHVLAVSGLHVGLLYAVLRKLSGGRRGKGVSLATLFGIFVYTALAGFSVSSLRAGSMIALHIASFHLYRRYDMLSAAGLTALVFLLFSPLLLFDSGSILSFAAAFVIGTSLPWLDLKLIEMGDRYKSSFILKAGRAVLPGFLIQIGLLPLSVFYFLKFSPVAFVINPLVIALSGSLLSVGLLMFVIFFLFWGIAGLLGGGFAGIGLGKAAELCLRAVSGPGGALAKLIVLINRIGTMLGASCDAPAPPFGALLLFYILFFFFFSETRHVLVRKGKKKLLVLGFTALLSTGVLAPYLLGITESFVPWDYALPAVTFVDVGQGDCIHIHYKDKDVLIDGGGNRFFNIAERTLKPYLLKCGVTDIDLALPTHKDTDHYLGLQELSEIMSVNLKEPGFLSEGDIVNISDDIYFAVLSPDKKVLPNESTNDLSLVGMLFYEGFKILLTGDLEKAGEGALLSKAPAGGLCCDVLKAAHHGSGGSTSEAFLAAASPALTVISCGKNNRYGHPAKRVLDLLGAYGISYLRTDESGAVRLYIKNGKMKVKTVR